MFSWADPNPSNATSAALSSQYKVDAAQIGQVVAAIMASRDRQAALQQDQQQFQQKQIQSQAQDYERQQNAGQADDAANAAIYGSQYPNDPYGGFTDPNRVPDYGGTAALGGVQKNIADQIAQERVNAYMSKAYGGGVSSPQIYTAPSGQQFVVGSGGGLHSLDPTYGVPDVSKADQNRLLGYSPDQISTISQIPDNMIPGGGTNPITGEHLSGTQVLQVREAARAYQNALQGGYQPQQQPYAPPGPVQGSAGVRQPDIEQAKQAQASENRSQYGLTPGTKREVNGKTYEWDGTGWLLAQ